MRKVFYKLFGIYHADSINVFRFSFLAFMWSFGISIADTLSVSLFLENAGAQLLPISYLVCSVSMIAASCLFLYLLRKYSSYQILVGVMSVEISFYLLSYFIMLGSPPIWFWFILQTCTYLFVDTLVASFWTFIDQYHDLQEAKRIFSIYNACYLIGYMTGGAFINLTYEFLGYKNLFIFVTLILGSSIFIARYINKNTACVEDESIDLLLSEGKKGAFAILKIFFKSPFAVTLAFMSITILLLRTLTEFGYMTTISQIFEKTNPSMANQDSIAEFLGKIKAFIYLGNIIVGILFYKRFIGRIGVANMVLIPPIYFSILYSEWLITASMVVAIMGIIAVEGIIPAIEDNDFNILNNAAPLKLRGSLRMINDSFFEPMGTLFGSICLLFLNIFHIRLCGLFWALVCLVLALATRSLYLKALFTNLRENTIHFERKIKDWMSRYNKKEQNEVKEDLLKALNAPDIERSAFETLISLNDDTILPHLLRHANTCGEKGKIKIMDLLNESSFRHNHQVITTIHNWIKQGNSEDVVKWGNIYLAKRGLLNAESLIGNLDSENLHERAAAIIALKKSANNNPSLPGSGLNLTIAIKELDLLLKAKNEDEICMGLEILQDAQETDSFKKVINLLTHESLKVKQMAAKTLAKIANKSLCYYATKILDYIKHSSDNIIRTYCLEALGKISDSSIVKEIILTSLFFRPNERRLTEKIIINMGLKTVPILLSLTKDTNLHERCRILSSKILGKLALPQLQANLIEIIEQEIEEAYFYYFYGHTIQKQNPNMDLSLLQDALLTGFQSVIDFIIHLLGTAGSVEDSDLLVHTLRSKNAKAHAHAVEILEKNCDTAIFAKIRPLIDDTPWEEKVEAFSKINGKYPNLTLQQLLDNLQASPSFFDKTVAVHLKAKLQMPDWKQSLREQIKISDDPFYHYAYELLESSQ